MVVPRVFISSTYYNLRHVRNAIKEFIESVGFQPVLSEEFDVFYAHGKSAQQSCLDETKKCDFYILIIGTRYGTIFPNDSLSITHREYREAVEANLQRFVFIDKYVFDDYRFYCQNKDNCDIDASKIKYSHVRDTEAADLFKFISEVDNKEIDNAIIHFDQIAEITDYLRKQLARMFKEKALQPAIEEAAGEEAIDMDEYQKFVRNLDIVGITPIEITDIRNNANFLELLESKADSLDDFGSDIRISIGGSTVNIGKAIIDLLSNQYQQMKGGGRWDKR